MIDAQHAKLITFMKAHKGRNNPVSSTMLAAALGCSNEEARAIYGNVVRQGEALLGSHGNGYFMIVDEQDFELSTAHLTGRIRSISDRLRSLNKMFEDGQTLPIAKVQEYMHQAQSALKFNPDDERHCNLMDEAREVIEEQKPNQKDFDSEEMVPF